MNHRDLESKAEGNRCVIEESTVLCTISCFAPSLVPFVLWLKHLLEMG